MSQATDATAATAAANATIKQRVPAPVPTPVPTSSLLPDYRYAYPLDKDGQVLPSLWNINWTQLHTQEHWLQTLFVKNYHSLNKFVSNVCRKTAEVAQNQVPFDLVPGTMQVTKCFKPGVAYEVVVQAPTKPGQSPSPPSIGVCKIVPFGEHLEALYDYQDSIASTLEETQSHTRYILHPWLEAMALNQLSKQLFWGHINVDITDYLSSCSSPKSASLETRTASSVSLRNTIPGGGEPMTIDKRITAVPGTQSQRPCSQHPKSEPLSSTYSIRQRESQSLQPLDRAAAARPSRLSREDREKLHVTWNNRYVVIFMSKFHESVWNYFVVTQQMIKSTPSQPLLLDVYGQVLWSLFAQIMFRTLPYYKQHHGMCQNDSKIDNMMYIKSTSVPHVFVRLLPRNQTQAIMLKIPTFTRVIHPMDYGFTSFSVPNAPTTYVASLAALLYTNVDAMMNVTNCYTDYYQIMLSILSFHKHYATSGSLHIKSLIAVILDVLKQTLQLPEDQLTTAGTLATDQDIRTFYVISSQCRIDPLPTLARHMIERYKYEGDVPQGPHQGQSQKPQQGPPQGSPSRHALHDALTIQDVYI
jgi:hypothetical protein